MFSQLGRRRSTDNPPKNSRQNITIPITNVLLTLRTNCCKIKLTPQVANKVSKGLPYKNLITPLSNANPAKAVTIKAIGMAKII